jgi:hypothetical protein
MFLSEVEGELFILEVLLRFSVSIAPFRFWVSCVVETDFLVSSLSLLTVLLPCAFTDLLVVAEAKPESLYERPPGKVLPPPPP